MESIGREVCLLQTFAEVSRQIALERNRKPKKSLQSFDNC